VLRRVKLSGIVTGNDFLPGHQLRIEIAGSNFPLFERNLQTGGRNYDATSPQSATRVYHDREHAPYVEMAVMAKQAQHLPGRRGTRRKTERRSQ
jgi:uncharacterized protein